jgi:hypothetical protein
MRALNRATQDPVDELEKEFAQKMLMPVKKGEIPPLMRAKMLAICPRPGVCLSTPCKTDISQSKTDISQSHLSL